MAIFNKTKKKSLPYPIWEARSPIARLTGLLGTLKPENGRGLCITPCTGVHTFGMKYPIDVVFLNAEGKVVEFKQNLVPNRMTRIIPSARSVLEFPSDTVMKDEIRVGDELLVTIDKKQHLDWRGLSVILHWPLNFCIAGLWALLLYSYYLRWQNTGQMLGLGLVLVNTVLCVLFLTRRESRDTSHQIPDWIIPIVTVGLSMILRPHPAEGSALTVLSLSFQFTGIAALFGSLFCLGRSFGIVPANRGIKTMGLYRIVRHPVYASELVFYLGFLLGNPSLINLQLVALISAGQAFRILSEEHLLSRENVYCDYMSDVRYRLLPGIF